MTEILAGTDAWKALAERIYPKVVGRRYAPTVLTLGGLETRNQSERYHWDGLQRGADLAHPFVLFQVTLTGHGIFEDQRSGTERLTSGRGFAAVIPSAHRYYLPEDSPEWTFFWIILRHPYLARRIGERQQAVGSGAAVLDLAPDSPLLLRAISLLTDRFTDLFAEEAALFQFLIEYERHVHTRLASTPTELSERERLLTALRRQVLGALSQPLAVVDAARTEGMSRTQFSHHFKSVTGIAPAAYMAQIRLEEAARRLAQTDITLAALAQETGFADANHLCKVFRRHYHLSPGAFRRQMQ